MPVLEPFTHIGPYRVLTYTLYLSLAILVSGVLVVLRTYGRFQVGRVVDVLLGTWLAAVVMARLVHVGLNRSYFMQNPGEAQRLSLGGLDWHGALVGGLIGLYVIGRWRRIMIVPVLEAFVPGVALLALAAWGGCLASGCAYGAEVATLADHPSFAVSEARDIFGIVAPRYNTQLLGVIFALVMLLLAVIPLSGRHIRGLRFWLLIVAAGLSTFAIGFWRDDATYLVVGVRADQWLDLAVVMVGIMMVIAVVRAHRIQER